MKGIFTLFTLLAVILVSSWQLQAQTPRKALAELATQASCPPCASNNPITLATINANADNAILLAYQVWWPGFDPMFLDNEEEVRDRIEYYGVTGAPTVMVQGTTNAGLNLNQGDINLATASMSEFALNLEAEFLDGMINVTGSVEAEMVANGNFRLRIALAEKLITIQDAPGGTNGESEYHHVFKRFIGGSNGINLADSWAAGDTYDIDMSMSVTTTNVYNYDQLEIVAWIQNDDTRYVHQAAKVDDLDMNFSYSNNATVSDVDVLIPAVCVGDNITMPSFTLSNIGSETLTSADITYSVNGGDEQVYNWTGSLEPLEIETVNLEEISFEHLNETSTLSVSVVNVNGVGDENADDSTAALDITTATNVAGELRLVLKTDDAGDETYWQVANSQGDVIASGGNATVGLTNIGIGFGSAPDDPGAYGNNQFIVENIPLPEDDCYTFTITDYYGDGFGLGAGFYNLIANGESFNLTDDFEAEENRLFVSDLSVGTKDTEFANTFKVSPNPVTDQAKIVFTLESPDYTTISIVNTLGQVVSRHSQGRLSDGTHQVDMDMSELTRGIYLINIQTSQLSGTQTIVVE